MSGHKGASRFVGVCIIATYLFDGTSLAQHVSHATYPDTWIREYPDDRTASPPLTLTDGTGTTVKTKTGGDEVFVIINYLGAPKWFETEPMEIKLQGFFDGRVIEGRHKPNSSGEKYEDLNFSVETTGGQILTMHPLKGLPSPLGIVRGDSSEFILPANKVLRIVREYKFAVLKEKALGFFTPECERWSDRLVLEVPNRQLAWSKVLVVLPAHGSSRYCQYGGTLYDGNKLANPAYQFDDQLTGPIYSLEDGSLLVRFLQHLVRMEVSESGVTSGATHLRQYEASTVAKAKSKFLAEKVKELQAANESFEKCRKVAVAAHDSDAMKVCGERFFLSDRDFWSLPLVNRLLEITPLAKNTLHR